MARILGRDAGTGTAERSTSARRAALYAAAAAVVAATAAAPAHGAWPEAGPRLRDRHDFSAAPQVHPVDQFYGVAVGPDGNTVVIVGAWGTVLRSVDGGRSFVRSEVERGMFSLFSVDLAPDGRQCLVVGERAYLGWSDDACETIRRVPPGDVPESVALLRVRRHGGLLAASGDNGLLLRSADGGKSWRSTIVGQLTYFDVQFVSEREGWAVGEFETLLHTTDGGASWTTVRGGDPMELTKPAYLAVSFANARHGLVAGLGVSIETRDAGATWQEVPLPAGSSIIGASFGPGDLPVLVGLRGSLLVRPPGGGWVQTRQTYGWLSGVTFAGAAGYAVGGNGTVLRTGDGGATWGRLFPAETGAAVEAARGTEREAAR